jgi:hypothetical protein
MQMQSFTNQAYMSLLQPQFLTLGARSLTS